MRICEHTQMDVACSFGKPNSVIASLREGWTYE